MKKRVAFFLTGELRNFMKLSESHINFIDKELYEVDFFILTWDTDNKNIKLPKNIIDNVKNIYNPIIFDFVNRENFRLNKKKYFIIDDTGNWIVQNYFWFKLFLLFKEYKIKNKVNYDKIIRTRPDILLINKSLNFSNIHNDVLYSWYEKCPKWGKVPFGHKYPNSKNIVNDFITKHIKLKLNISDSILDDFELTNIKQYINLDLLKVNDIKNTDINSFCDWLNIGNFENTEIICSTFLVVLLFLSNDIFPENFFFDGNNGKRILPFDYFIHINKVKTEILSNEYKHIVYKEEFFKQYPGEWL